MAYAVIALAAVALALVGMFWRVSVQLHRVERLDQRLSHLAEALALLTDTTEAGLSNVAHELEQASKGRAARAGSRLATAKRIVTATRRGKSLEEIAATESLSESEIRLHLEMAGDDRELRERGRDAALRV